MSTSSYKARTEAEFPTALPSYGVWWSGHTFTLHKSLAATKGAITASGTNNYENSWGRVHQDVIFNQEVKVYELHGATWHLIYEMHKGDKRDDHELWKGVAPKGMQSVSKDDVDAAIKSILGSQ